MLQLDDASAAPVTNMCFTIVGNVPNLLEIVGEAKRYIMAVLKMLKKKSKLVYIYIYSLWFENALKSLERREFHLRKREIEISIYKALLTPNHCFKISNT